jgi:hypothetical protein
MPTDFVTPKRKKQILIILIGYYKIYLYLFVEINLFILFVYIIILLFCIKIHYYLIVFTWLCLRVWRGKKG